MIYAYTVQQPKHDWYKETDKDFLVNVGKIYEKFGSTTACCGHSFMQSPVVIQLVISLMFQNEHCFNEHQVF